MSDLPQKVIEAAESQLGSPYCFGAWGEFCTPTNRRRRERADHPTIVSKCQVLNGKKSTCDGCAWQGDRMFDCRGFTDWCLKQVDINLVGEGATSQYNSTANWLEKGQIADMPECVCCVFIADGNKKSHTGLYIGGGYTIECSGTVYKQSLASKWTHYAIPNGLYTADEIKAIRADRPRPKRTLRKGDTGADVKDLQRHLNELGFECGSADGIFGARTATAVKAFQQENGLTPDGIVGARTWAALDSYRGIIRYTITIKNLDYSSVRDLLVRYPDAVFEAEGDEDDE